MTSMVEKVARAIDDAASSYLKEHEEKAKIDATIIPCIGMADIPPTVLARAAIEAMREPSPSMMSAGADCNPSADTKDPYGYAVAIHETADIYEAMIDAALKETP